ncbi:MAG TPA: hypothetical protein GX403_03030 [Rhodocyclaceae bacterium]|nr:hypothetical protein [Rhodocyclaceae bacterium]
MKIDDDTLIAYLDAQLEDDAAYEAVENALATSPALSARLPVLPSRSSAKSATPPGRRLLASASASCAGSCAFPCAENS